VDPNGILGWSAGEGALSHNVYLGTGFNDVNNADALSPEFKGNQTATIYAISNLDVNTTYYWRIDEAGPRCTAPGSVWRFITAPQPGAASNPNPTNSAINVSLTQDLSWTAGVHAASHNVYMGTVFDDVNNAGISSPEFKGNKTAANYDPCSNLDVNTTYYWRVDEKNSAGTTKGNVWNFKTLTKDPNLVSWWRFDEGTGSIAHDSADSHNGTIYGAAWTTEGQINGALDFNGVNNYVDYGDIDEFEFGSKNFTISFWFNTEGAHNIGGSEGAYGIIIGKYNVDSGKQWSFSQNPAGKITFATYYSSSGSEGLASTNSYAGQWVHCVGVRNGAKKYLYFNGIVDVNGTCQGVQTGKTTKVLAGAVQSSTKTYDFFNGKIDDIRVYNRALSAVEV
jgi:hypothetical protein